MPTLATETDRLAQLALSRRDCLAQMHALGGMQPALIDSGDMTQLLAVLAAKQRLLGELVEFERALDPFRGQVAESRHWRDAHERATCAALLAEGETLLRRILEQEQAAERRLSRRRDETAALLQGVNAADQARRAYADRSPPASSLDLHTEA